jgi:hypothetical protein
MLEAAKMQGNNPELCFDHKVIKWLGELLLRFIVHLFLIRKTKTKTLTNLIKRFYKGICSESP